MLACIIVLAICIFGFMVVGHATRNLHYFINLVVVMCVCVFHYNDKIRLISR